MPSQIYEQAKDRAKTNINGLPNLIYEQAKGRAIPFIKAMPKRNAKQLEECHINKQRDAKSNVRVQAKGPCHIKRNRRHLSQASHNE